MNRGSLWLASAVGLSQLAATLCASIALAAPSAASPRQFANCSHVRAIAPYGLARDSKSAARAVKAGNVPPRVSRSLYARATKLDPDGAKGFVCPLSQAAARQANAEGYFGTQDSEQPAEVSAGAAFAVKDSLADQYIQYLTRSTEASLYSQYGSLGLTPPGYAPPSVLVVGDVITVTRGSTSNQYVASFDPYGRLQTWSTSVGPLEQRLFPIQGSGTGVGVLIELDWAYQTILGSVVATGHVTNSGGQPIRLNTATYTGADGMARRAYVVNSDGTCVQPGQRVPISPSTFGAAQASPRGTWAFDVVYCAYYPTLGTVLVPFESR